MAGSRLGRKVLVQAQWSASHIIAAPKPSWIIVTYYAAQFLVGVWLDIDNSYEMPGPMALVEAGLGWLLLTNFFFFAAPWIHESLVSRDRPREPTGT